MTATDLCDTQTRLTFEPRRISPADVGRSGSFLPVKEPPEAGVRAQRSLSLCGVTRARLFPSFTDDFCQLTALHLPAL
ncbi:hypothetical protein Q8A67_004281 [Cirrhinus molitorella]|uniref:Uncharacterized protein n=1 Tax=Cirrhinus molitorella TaxID=172907 RepID=A0AA88Q213_9TELE|nr:hypothetical protein Q8A67_004281 [Cirrhinus molitorella]